MTKEHNQFVKKLSYKDSETSQKEIAKECIRKELFKIIYEFDVENGRELDLNHAVELISNRLGMQELNNKIEEYVSQVLQSGKYKYTLDSKGKIKEDFGKLDILQKKYSDERNKRAIERLESFVQRTEIYANELSKQNSKITAENLKNQFTLEDQERNKTWIELAITRVLKNRDQER